MSRGLVLRVSALAASLRLPFLRGLACLLLLGLAECRAPLPPSMAHPLVGYACPPIEENTVYGQPVVVPAFAPRRVTVVDFWASWCGACQDTMPALEAIWRSRKDDNLLVVGVSLDDRAEEAARGAEYFGVSFPIVHDSTHRLASDFSVYQIPTTFVLDRRGAVRFVGRDPASIRRAVLALLDD